MARLDFECPVCHAQVLDRVAPAGTPPPVCHHVEHTTFYGVDVFAQSTEPPAEMEIAWAGCAVDAIHPFEYEHDDGRKEVVSTLHRAREIERSSERAAASGEGRLAVFRHLAQSQSNMGVNVFQADHPQVRREQLLRQRRGKPIISVGKVDVTVHGDPHGSEDW